MRHYPELKRAIEVSPWKRSGENVGLRRRVGALKSGDMSPHSENGFASIEGYPGRFCKMVSIRCKTESFS